MSKRCKNDCRTTGAAFMTRDGGEGWDGGVRVYIQVACHGVARTNPRGVGDLLTTGCIFRKSAAKRRSLTYIKAVITQPQTHTASTRSIHLVLGAMA